MTQRVPTPSALSTVNTPPWSAIDLAGDRQSQTAAVGRRERSTRDAVTKRGEFFLRDAASIVLHLDERVRSDAAHGDAQVAVFAAARMAQTVVDQVLQRQHHGPLIRTDERKVVRHVHVDANAVLTEPKLKALERLVDELRSGHRLERIRFRHVGDPGIRQQVVDLPAQVGGFLNEQVRISRGSVRT